MKTRILSLFVLLCAATVGFSGCAWFVIGAAGGLMVALSGEDDAVPGPVNAPPAIAVTAPSSNELVSDRVNVRYTLVDPEGQDCSLRVEYSTDGGGSWSDATQVQAYPNEGVAGLASSPSGIAHIFVWNSFNDVGNANFPDAAAGNGLVRLRLTPTDGGGLAGSPVSSAEFRLYNGYVSTFFGGELTDVPLAFPSGLLFQPGTGGSAGTLYVSDEFQGRVLALNLDTGLLSTRAGTGTSGYTGDNVPADTAGLTQPAKLAVDGASNLFIADTRSHRVRRVDGVSDFITTLLGTGQAGYAGDGGAPAAAQVDTPSCVAFDQSRQVLYVGEVENRCIRAVNLGASTRRIAGTLIPPGAVATVIGDPRSENDREADGPAGLPGSVGMYASMALNASGDPRIAYYDETNEQLRFAAYVASKWVVDVVDIQGGVGSHCSLALDSLGRPHIAYYDETNGALKYATIVNTDWSISIVDAQGDAGTWTSIAVDSFNNPSIAYCAGQDGEIRYAAKTGNFWQIEFVGTDGAHLCLALDASNRPHLCWQDTRLLDLMYRYKSGGSWQDLGGSSTVVWTGNVGAWARMALDASSFPHLVYYDTDSNNGDPMYLRWNGATWTVPVSVDDSSGDAGAWCSLVLDASSRPRVSYFDRDTYGGTLMHAADLNGNGVFEATERWAVDGQFTWESVGSWTATAISGNTVRIAYVHDQPSWPADQGRLRCAFQTGPATFNRTLVDGGTSAGLGRPYALKTDAAGNLYILTQSRVKFFNAGNTALHIGQTLAPPGYVVTLAGQPAPFTRFGYDAGGTGYVLYNNPGAGTLRLATKTLASPVWTYETVPDPSGSVGEFPSLAVRLSDGSVHASYWDQENDTIRYAVKVAGSWTLESPLGTAAPGQGPFSSMALDPTGAPCIAYYDRTGGDLMYVSRAGGAWGVPVRVDGASGDVGAYPSLAFAGTGLPAIAYQDLDNEALKFAAYNGSSWVPVTVDDPADAVGSWISLAFGAGAVHISYYAEGRRSLKYASFTGSWQTVFVDGFGDMGRHSSMGVNGSGQPCIAYLDDANGRGALARWNGTAWEYNEFGWNGASHPHLVLDPSGNYFISYAVPSEAGAVRLQTISSDLSNWNEFRVESYDGRDQFAGDGKPALAARFSELKGLALGRYGSYAGTAPEFDTLFVADGQNSRIRAINLNDPEGSNAVAVTVANVTIQPGCIDTVLGNGAFGYDPNDDGAVANNAVNPVELGMPQDVEVDAAGNLFVADALNLRIRFLNLGSSPRTVAGVTIQPGCLDSIAAADAAVLQVSSLFYPSGITVDPADGSVYVTDYSGLIFRIARDTRVSTVVAGTAGGFGFGFAGDGGPATQAKFWGAHDIAVDRERNLYILDRGNVRIRVVNLHNAQAGYDVCGVPVEQGNIATVVGSDILTYTVDGPGGDPSDELGDGLPVTQATTTEIVGLAVDRRPLINGVASSRGILYFTDRQNRRVRAVNLNPAGSQNITVCGTVTLAPGQVRTVLGTGVEMWNLDGPGGNPLDDFVPGGASTSTAVGEPGPLAMDRDGILLVMDRRFGVVLAVNTANNSGGMVEIAGWPVAGTTVDRVGGGFFIEPGYNGDGIPFRQSAFASPEFIAVWREGYGTPAERQEIYISDRGTQRIRLAREDGFIWTWAGTGEVGFNGDGVPPANVLLNEPGGVAVHEDGARLYVYYVDSRNKRVRWQVR